MPNQIEHFIAAERLLIAGVDVVQRISTLAEQRAHLDPEHELWSERTRQMDELGKKAMGIWAQAQVHATLATIVLGHDDQMWIAKNI